LRLWKNLLFLQIVLFFIPSILHFDPKKLWRNIRSFDGVMSEGSDNVAFAFSADDLNTYFTSPAAGIDPPDLAHVTYRPLIEGDSLSF
jgi:hypothetical protein